jgi:hypothetical protein
MRRPAVRRAVLGARSATELQDTAQTLSQSELDAMRSRLARFVHHRKFEGHPISVVIDNLAPLKQHLPLQKHPQRVYKSFILSFPPFPPATVHSNIFTAK